MIPYSAAALFWHVLLEDGARKLGTGGLGLLMSSPTPSSVPVSRRDEPSVDLTVLRKHVRANLPSGHPFRIAVEALPESLRQEEYLLHLRVLLPLARLEGA